MDDNEPNQLNKIIYLGTAIVNEVIQMILESDASDTDDEEYNSSETIYFFCDHRTPSTISTRILVYTRLNDAYFRSHFRLMHGSVEILMKLMGKDWQNTIGRTPVDITSGILLSLWYLATKETFREVADRFEVSRSQAHRIVTKFNKALSAHANKFIKWPTREEMITVVNDFNRLRGNVSFPNVFGCIDGTHIEIPKQRNGNSYYNRKGYHSVVIQAVCDAKMYFQDVYIGWPGSVSDSRIWRNSPIYAKLSNEPQCIIAGSHLLGDKAYPLNTFLMVPFKNNGHLSENEKTRVIIEQAFAHLKNAFRCSHFLNRMNLIDIKDQLMTVCILHNIRLTESYPFEELPIQEDDNYEHVNAENNLAVDKRNYLVHVTANLS